jgi:hypothetical protein
VRSAAVARLKDQSVLARVAHDDRQANVRSTAVLQLAPGAALNELALHSTERELRRLAISRVTVAQHVKDPLIRARCRLSINRTRRRGLRLLRQGFRADLLLR